MEAQQRATTENNSYRRREFGERNELLMALQMHDEHHGCSNLHRRFQAEPDTVFLRMTGQEIKMPKYNGVMWWFPDRRPNSPKIEVLLCYLFSIVCNMQTLFIILWPLDLFYRYGWVVLMSLTLTVPLGSKLENTFGENYGTAYSSVNVLHLTHQATHWFMERQAQEEEEQSHWIVISVFFVLLLFTIGYAYCTIELCLGRTSFAFIVVCAQCLWWAIEFQNRGKI
uniref:Uncharacterized protein n=1 Tax=Leptocylindrus danicus TaxID=163516 RepID=A0A7S2L7K2_9STRA|mmetsp:Transcript_33000/g.47788  ORF Transcript_33000/g.47788 Transcript_33000/m.47788 type:complete len:226 (+) Transcript_33000:192-869(+)